MGGVLIRIVADFVRAVSDGGIFFSLESFLGLGRSSDFVVFSLGCVVIYLESPRLLVWKDSQGRSLHLDRLSGGVYFSTVSSGWLSLGFYPPDGCSFCRSLYWGFISEWSLLQNGIRLWENSLGWWYLLLIEITPSLWSHHPACWS